MNKKEQLIKSIKNGNVEIAMSLLENNTHLKDDDTFNQALFWAIFNKNLEITKLLITHGANVNGEIGTSKHKQTFLHLAIQTKNLEITKLLITHGANINIKGQNGLSPLQYAFIIGSNEIIKLLIAHEANIDFKINDNFLKKLHWKQITNNINLQVIIAKKLYQEYEKQVTALIQKLHLPSGFKNITFDEKENVLSLMSLCQKKIKASLGTDVLPYQTLTII